MPTGRGNIYYLWNASVPALPHASGDTTAGHSDQSRQRGVDAYVAFDSLPQVLDPPGGYVHNENDAPYYTNMRAAAGPQARSAVFPRAASRASQPAGDRSHRQ